MMPDRKMFWRIIRRLLGANRGRLSVILLALGAGAAITAALLNLQVDAKRRLTTEFRALGANVIIAPSAAGMSTESPRFLNDSLFAGLSEGMDSSSVPKAEFLYGIVEAAKAPATKEQKPGASTKVILAGFQYSGSPPEQVLSPALVTAVQKMATANTLPLDSGQRTAHALQLRTRCTLD